MRHLFFIGILLSISCSLIQAQGMVEGIVKDEEGNRLIGALVQLKTDGCMTITDEKGKFQMHCPTDTSYQLKISYTGYQTTTITLDSNAQEPVQIVLPSLSEQLDLVTVEEDKNDAQASLDQTQINQTEIRRQNKGNLAKTLENIAGVNAINVGVGIAKPMIRGLSFNRLVVRSQGIKQEGQQWGGDHGLEMDQFDVDRVELVKGAQSLQYGSDALGGSINILPTRIPERNSLRANILGLYKSNNHHLGGSAYLGMNLDDVFFDLRWSYQDFEDYRVPTDSFVYNGFVLPIYNNVLKNTAGKEQNLKGSLGILRDWGLLRLTVSRYHLKAGIFSGAMGIPRAYQLQEDGNRRKVDVPNQEVQHWKASLNFDFKLSESDRLKLNVGYQHNLRQEFSYPHLHGRPPLENNPNLALQLTLQTLSANGFVKHKYSEQWQSQTGFTAQYQDNQRAGFEFLIPDFQTVRTGLYHLLDFRPSKRLKFEAGLRLDYAYNHSESYAQPIYLPNGELGTESRAEVITQHDVNYSAVLGSNYQLIPRKWWLRANFSKSFRVPYPNELASNGVHHGNFRHEMGNPDLQAEEGYQLDVSTQWRSKRFGASLATYFNYFDGFIYLGPSGQFSTLPEAGQVFRYQQNDAIYTGLEAEWQYEPIEGFNLQQAYEYVWNINLQTSLSLPFTPPASVLTTVGYEYPKLGVFEDLYIQAQHRYSFAQNAVDRNELPTPAYHLVDLRLGCTLNIRQQPLHINLQVQNLFNTAYLQHLSRYRLLNIPEQGRNFVLAISLPINHKLK